MSTAAKPTFKPINFGAEPKDFDKLASAAEKFSHERNIPSLTFPQNGAEAGEGAQSSTPVVALDHTDNKDRKPVKPAVATTPALQRVPVVLPAYAVADIKQRALDANTSHRYVIMQALRKGGIFIADEDMVEDGRRIR